MHDFLQDLVHLWVKFQLNIIICAFGSLQKNATLTNWYRITTYAAILDTVLKLGYALLPSAFFSLFFTISQRYSVIKGFPFKDGGLLFITRIRMQKKICNFTTLLKPYNIGTHLKGIETSFQVVPLFFKSFHVWVSYITFWNYLEISSVFNLFATPSAQEWRPTHPRCRGIFAKIHHKTPFVRKICTE
jgi:hypothetical protein